MGPKPGFRKIAPRFVGCTQEDHQQPIYAVSFFERPIAAPRGSAGADRAADGGAAPRDADDGRAAAAAAEAAAAAAREGGVVHLASAGGNRATVYALDQGTGKLEVCQLFLDSDGDEQCVTHLLSRARKRGSGMRS